MYELVLTKLAEDDLDNIVHYLSVILANPLAATVFLDRLEEVCQFLRENPKMYALSRDAILRVAGYRVAAVKKYLLVYRVVEHTVVIYRMFHGTQAYQKILLADVE